MKPAQAAELGMVARLGAKLVVPSSWTCKSPTARGNTYSTIDFFMLHSDLTHLVMNVSVVEGVPLAPHRPVMLTLRHHSEMALICVPNRKLKLPKACPYGPCPPEDSWKDFEDLDDPRKWEDVQRLALTPGQAGSTF